MAEQKFSKEEVKLRRPDLVEIGGCNFIDRIVNGEKTIFWTGNFASWFDIPGGYKRQLAPEIAAIVDEAVAAIGLDLTDFPDRTYLFSDEGQERAFPVYQEAHSRGVPFNRLFQ